MSDCLNSVIGHETSNNRQYLFIIFYKTSTRMIDCLVLYKSVYDVRLRLSVLFMVV